MSMSHNRRRPKGVAPIDEISAPELYGLRERSSTLSSPMTIAIQDVNTLTWGEPVDDVPAHLLVPLDGWMGADPHTMQMSLGLIKGLPGGDPKDTPNLDPLVESTEIIDEDAP